MADKPILFSGPMVRALLAGTKTQTRRTLNPQPELADGSWRVRWGSVNRVWQEGLNPGIIPNWLRIAVDDRLWVREAHALLPRTAYRASIGTGTIAQVEHPTDGYSAAVFREGFDRSGRPLWRPSIHMPRWASRLTLTVTDVRVEKLQDISRHDAEAEGIERIQLCGAGTSWKSYDPGHASHVGWVRAEQSYQSLWNSINGPCSWDANPWVAAYTFTIHQGNIDAPA